MYKHPKILSVRNLKKFVEKQPTYSITGMIGKKLINEYDWSISEKIDGSQFRILLTKEGYDCGSKNVDGCDNVDRMFEKAKEQARRIYRIWIESKLPEMILFTEFLRDKKHNVLKYDRVPRNHLYLFAAYNIQTNTAMTNDELKMLADKFDIEPPNILGVITGINEDLLNRVIRLDSILGGSIEGVVLTSLQVDGNILFPDNYPEGFPLKLKYVSNRFKEVAVDVWGGSAKRPDKIVSTDDIVKYLLDKYVTEARMNKIIMYMMDDGTYTGTNADIGNLIRAYVNDLFDEEYNNILDDVASFIMPKFKKALGRKIAKMYMSR